MTGTIVNEEREAARPALNKRGIGTVLPSLVRRKIKPGQIVAYAFLILVTLISIYPIYFSFISSFKTVQEYTLSKSALPGSWNLENYAYVFRNLNFITYTRNSLFLVTLGMALYLFICNAAGFALGMLRFRFKLAVFSFILFFLQ